MSIFNEDELSAPKWMDAGFFENVLIKYENNEDIEVVDFDLTPASMKGDHYASVMYRASVNYKFGRTGPVVRKSMIVKTLPDEEGMKREMLMHGRFFETEIEMYATTLPLFEKILAKHGDPIRFAPRIIYHALQPNKVIILEDACELGYDCVRGRPLTLVEIQAIYTKLAKMHAVSYMLGQSEEHALVTKYQEGLFSNELIMTNEFISQGITKFIEMLSAHDEFDQYMPKFKAVEKEMFDSCIQLYNSYKNGAKNEMFVLNHGDCHLKNMMFKFSKKNKLEDFFMVDFQISLFGPSVIDMIYSTFMLLSSDLRARRDELMYFYFTEFVNTLKKIEFKGNLPKFADFQISSIKYRHFAIFLLSTFLPMVISMLSLRPEDMKDVDNSKMLEDSDMSAMFYRNPVFVSEVKKMLPGLLLAGYLD